MKKSKTITYSAVIVGIALFLGFGVVNIPVFAVIDNSSNVGTMEIKIKADNGTILFFEELPIVECPDPDPGIWCSDIH
jgi:hypothetical protein